mgnify:FL=1
MAFLPILRQISSTKPAGPSRTFTELQVVRALLILGERKILGRTLLSRLLKTGSGAIRTMISDLEEHGIINIEKSGCSLTLKGLNVYKEIHEKIPKVTKIDAGRLSISNFDAAALVNDVSKLIHHGIEQRDAAIRVGAKGATTLIYENNKFTLPRGSIDCAKDFPSDIWIMLEKLFNPSDGDVIIVSSADNEESAIYGSLAGALTLVDDT